MNAFGFCIHHWSSKSTYIARRREHEGANLYSTFLHENIDF